MTRTSRNLISVSNPKEEVWSANLKRDSIKLNLKIQIMKSSNFGILSLVRTKHSSFKTKNSLSSQKKTSTSHRN